MFRMTTILPSKKGAGMKERISFLDLSAPEEP
jgi:hypothetical protein